MSHPAGPLLRAANVSRRFRGLMALSNYDLTLARGEILGVIGPNGAGKTTLFNVMTGFLRPTTGTIEMLGQDITRLRPDQVARHGIARTFQTNRLFGKLSVLDNVKIAQQLHVKTGFFETLASAGSFYRKERELEHRAMEHLDDLGLANLAAHPAAALPYGSQRKVEIARALALEPQVMLLDEPAAGMNANETSELLGFIRGIHARRGLSIIVVEHDMSLIMRLCDRIQVLNYGQTICEGSPERIRSDPAVIEAYLGTSSRSTRSAPSPPPSPRGINISQVIMVAFIIGAGMAAVAGILFGVRVGKIDPLLGFIPLLKAFVATVIGGFGSIPGAVLGAYVLGFLEIVLAGSLPSGMTAYRDALIFALLIVVLLVRPQGILGSTEAERV